MALKDRILVAASIIIRKRGYEGMTIRDICDMIEISPGNYSYHFPRKTDLMRAILRQYWEKEVTWHEGFFETSSSITGLLNHFNQFFITYNDHRQILRLHYHQLADLHEQSIKSVRREYYSLFLQSLVDSGQINASEEDIIFLSAFMQFLVKAWSMDIADELDTLNSHIYMLAQQFYYFASNDGKIEISEFLASMDDE